MQVNATKLNALQFLSKQMYQWQTLLDKIKGKIVDPTIKFEMSSAHYEGINEEKIKI